MPVSSLEGPRTMRRKLKQRTFSVQTIPWKQYSGETMEDAHDHDMQTGSPNLVARASLDK